MLKLKYSKNKITVTFPQWWNLILIKQKWIWMCNCSRFSVRNVIWDRNFRVGHPASIFLLMIVVVPTSERKLKKNHSVTRSPQAQAQDKECKMLTVHQEAFTLFSAWNRYLDCRVDKINCFGLHFSRYSFVKPTCLLQCCINTSMCSGHLI